MKSRKLACELCGTEVAIRSTIKEGSNKGKKSCGTCKSKTGAKRSGLKPISKKTAEKNKKRSEQRSVYFDYHLKRCFKSEESGRPISTPTRANICHLFAKGLHQSLQAELNNYVYLTVEEHNKFDSLLFAHDFKALEQQFPRCWDMVCERLYSLLEDCEENTLFKARLKEYLEEKLQIQ